jgi:hypothetical protein
MGFLGDVGLKTALRASVFNTAQPSAGEDILSSDIDARNAVSFFHIYACMSNAGKLTLMKTVGSTTVDEVLNGDGNLAAGVPYLFTVCAALGEAINLKYSATGGTVRDLKVVELKGVV